MSVVAAPRGDILLAASAFVLLSASCAAMLAAMAAYPGGNWSDPHGPGFDLWRNYFCDLIRPVAHNGVANDRGMMLGRVAMVTTGVASVPVFVLLPRLVATHTSAVWSRRAGIAAVMLLPAVPLTPSNVAGSWHAVAIAAAGVPGCAALSFATFAIVSERRRRPWLAVASLVMLAAVAVTSVVYVVVLAGGIDGIVLPVSQKVAWIAFVVWQAAVAGSAVRSHPLRVPGAPPGDLVTRG